MGPLEAGRQQVGNAAHMVNVHMGDHQRPDVLDGELNGQLKVLLSRSASSLNPGAGHAVNMVSVPLRNGNNGNNQFTVPDFIDEPVT